MKKLATLIILLVALSVSSYAQFKVVKKSGRKPKWVNSSELDYVITSGTGATLDLAKEDALTKVREQIIQSITDKIKTETTYSKSEINNGDTFKNFESTIHTITEGTKYINSISHSNVKEFFWEKIKNKKTKTYHYNYHIKYPFTSLEMELLIDEYQFKKNQLTEELNKYVKAVETVTTIEDIKGNIDKLRILKKNFIDKRKDICNITIQKYINLIKKAEIEEITNETGILKFAILINGKRILTAKDPKISSNCANIISNTKEMDIWTIKYDTKDCFEDETNYINIAFNLPFTRFKKKIFLNISESKLDIKVNTSIGFKKNEEKKGEYKATIHIESKYPTEFIVESVVIEFKGINPITISDINMSFGKSKIHKLVFPIELSESEETSIITTNTLNGYISYKSKKTGEEKTYRIYKKAFYIE